MKKGLKLIKPLSIGIVAVIGLGLTVSALIMLSRHSDTIHELSKSQAQLNTDATRKIASNNLETFVNRTASYADYIRDDSETKVIEKINELIASEDDDIYSINYFKNENLYNSNGELIPHFDDLAFKYREEGKTNAAYLGSFIETTGTVNNATMQRFEFYCPVLSNGCFVDGLSVYYSDNEIKTLLDKSNFNNDCSFGALVNDQGVIYTLKDSEDLTRDTLNLYDNVRNFFKLKDNVDELTDLLTNHKTDTVFCKKDGTDYIISVCTNEKLADLLVVEIYNCDVLSTSNKTLINSIVSVLVLFILIIIGTIIYFVVQQAILKRKLTDSESTNIVLGCLNRHGFEKECAQIFERQQDGYYGVIIFEIRHFQYLLDNNGEAEVNNILRHIKSITSQSLKLEESYGYADNGEFLMIVHAKDKASLIDKLKIHSFLAGKYKGRGKIQLSLKYGIYERLQNDRTPISKMIDYAREANNAIVKATVENVDMQFNFYDDELRKIRLINEDMELRQEQALKDGEFQVYYQAKYNLKNEVQDGAEALVRWYDPETKIYNVPALFMPLFESNGFIEKLDKYVYTKVCEYVSYSIALGRKVFPISVNVSRITAVQPDFVDYYASMKRKYGIKDGAITIEFTESFAYENYDVLRNIVDKLHKNGFLCSIDDFGCGYSSYRILKELPMDEIKLDKFFIDQSDQKERVEHIYDSVISLAKNLKMKVTQEGVESKEDIAILRKYGCDVVQGYIYSKPISLTDYLQFCENSKSHKL